MRAYCLLKAKLRHFEFPHEIGVFLGFPIDDVIALSRTRDKIMSIASYWKVYAMPESTKRTFDLYDGLRSFESKTKLIGGIHDREAYARCIPRQRGFAQLNKGSVMYIFKCFCHPMIKKSHEPSS